MKNDIGTSIARTIHRVGFWTRKSSPELLIIGSILSAAASVFLACKATTKVDDILAPANQEIKNIHLLMTDDNKIASGEVTLPACKKELFRVYTKTAWGLIKIYAPAALLFGISVSANLGSHKIMKSRNIALAAAYSTLENGYRQYRDRVRAKIGDKAEGDIHRNVYSEDVTEIVTDKKGNEKEVTRSVKIPHIDPNSEFVYLFDESNPDWSRSGRINLDWLLARQRALNQDFMTRGYLFLYDVYRALGIQPEIIGARKLQASKILGWIYDPDHSGEIGDSSSNWVSFGLTDQEGNLTNYAMEMLRGNEPCVWLEFNVDGDILTGSENRKVFSKYAKYI